jgi:hypothetical protein
MKGTKTMTTIPNELRGQLHTPLFAKAYALAGNATFTVLNPDTGNRYTFKVKRKDVGTEAEPKELFFVGLLSGPDNDADYSFLGTIFDAEKFVHGRKSRVGTDAPSARAFTWLWSRLAADTDFAPAEFWHEGRCGRCGRKLTVPASIERGLGPVCAGAGQ